MSAFDDWFDRIFPDVEQWAAQFDAEPVVARPNVVPAEPATEGFLVPPGLTAQLAEHFRMISGQIDIADELLNPPPGKPLPWHTRLRYRISDWRERLARRAYRVIAGYWPQDEEDW